MTTARLPLGQVPMILMYHGVAEVAEDPNQLCVTPARFAEQMAWLTRRGLRGVSVATLVDTIHAAENARGMVGLTFDDGYRNVFEAALPVLRSHGFTATMFIVSERIGGTNEWDKGPSWPLLSAAEVGELARAGMEIGSHGATHTRLAGTDAGQLTAEVGGSRASLSLLTRTAIRGFAYPYGSMDAAARQAVADAGYDYACAVQAPVAAMGFAALPRVYVGQRDTVGRMAVKRLVHKGYLAIKGNAIKGKRSA